jgi:hypothetical protein
MVVALYGKCNGAGIVFSQDGQGRWTTAVPVADNKTYVIEVFAEDEAGNTSYFATVEATYNSSSLSMEFTVKEVGENFTLNEVLSVFRMSSMSTKWRA